MEVIVGDAVCRIEMSPATVRAYEREARCRGVSVANLLQDAVRSILADCYRLN
ncbi:MAG TPA: hypothetical protein VGW38_17285 [Chloroflexota bacterium]|nr:hypothetical protein [Chloroflexota bacterium]